MLKAVALIGLLVATPATAGPVADLFAPDETYDDGGPFQTRMVTSGFYQCMAASKAGLMAKKLLARRLRTEETASIKGWNKRRAEQTILEELPLNTSHEYCDRSGNTASYRSMLEALGF